MRKNIIIFAAGVVSGALGMKVAPKILSSLKRDDDTVDEIFDEFDELVDEFDDIVDSFDEPTAAPTPETAKEPTEAPTPEPTEATPSPENGDENKGGECDEQ